LSVFSVCATIVTYVTSYSILYCEKLVLYHKINYYGDDFVTFIMQIQLLWTLFFMYVSQLTFVYL